MRSVLISLLRYLVSVLVVVSVLTVFGVNVKSILAMASIGGIIVGFAMQTVIKDIIYGTLILAEGSIGVGDLPDRSRMSSEGSLANRERNPGTH